MEKPAKKARGGVASRKAKANSIAASAARSRGKTENKVPAPSPEAEEESPSSMTMQSKVGDLSFVLNAPTQSSPQSNPHSTPTKSPNGQPVKHSLPHSSSPLPSEQAASLSETRPSFTSTAAEPAHNRISPKAVIIDDSSCTHKEA